MSRRNPFALVRAADFSDEQINALWVPFSPEAITAVIEPEVNVSKFILGGRGTGKTHLLRYYSYPVARLRKTKVSGVSVVCDQKYLAIFLRATGLDTGRFVGPAMDRRTQQSIFGLYFELRLLEVAFEALTDIKKTSSNFIFDDFAFAKELLAEVNRPPDIAGSVEQIQHWLVSTRKSVDDAINNAAFTNSLRIDVPFSLGALCFRLATALTHWTKDFSKLPVIFFIDEIENFPESHQEVVNSLIRYAEGRVTFRISGRLYGRKTLSTIDQGEEIQEGPEFKTTYLDDIFRSYSEYSTFASKVLRSRVNNSAEHYSTRKAPIRSPVSQYEIIESKDFYVGVTERLRLQSAIPAVRKEFIEKLSRGGDQHRLSGTNPQEIATILIDGVPAILAKLNLLLYTKRAQRNQTSLLVGAKKIRVECEAARSAPGSRSSYMTAYRHWALDLFAQLCRESKSSHGVPYAGFDTFVRMSSENPRNLLLLLGRLYDVAEFKRVDFTQDLLTLELQTEAALEAARFAFESDANYGVESVDARHAVARLATILRTARYALNIPEVSPLAFSFSDLHLNDNARRTLRSALNYSMLIEISEGRPDRNSREVRRKVQLHPMLAPRWGLPVSRRGDISLGSGVVNVIFDQSMHMDFEALSKLMAAKWNDPFRLAGVPLKQGSLFGAENA